MNQFAQYFGKEGKVKKYLVDLFLHQGAKGKIKGGVAILISLYWLRVIAKNNGWLGKKSVRNQHVFITGGGSGLGKQMAIRFLKLQSKVTIVDVNFQAVKDVATDQQNLGFANIQPFQCDVSSFQSVQEAIRKATETFGPIDILINNAGIVSGKNILQNTPQAIERTIAVNTTAHFWTVKTVLPTMMARDSGHIVTIASIAGWVGVNGLADYCASKFGAVGFDESLRFELRAMRKRIKTTCICPYFINTGMFDGASSKFPLLLPILSEQYATNRIMNAILQEEEVVIMPYMGQVTVMLKSLLPVSCYDWLCEFFGASDSMKDFKGRQAPQQL